MVLLDSIKVYWTAFQYENWLLNIAATDRGLCFLSLPNESFEKMIHWIDLHIPNAILEENGEKMKLYTNQFKHYFQGNRFEFTLPLDLRGTPFQLSVWHAMLQIAHGQTQSYSELASLIRNPRAVRAVGAAIGANPVLIAVPCHRVIGKNGALTGYRGGMEAKRKLLLLEGHA